MLATMFRWLLLTTLVLGVFTTGNAPAPAAPQAVMVSLVSPSACPGSGCAAGQRLNMRSDYDLSAYDPAAAFNVQVCLYTPINWSANSLISSPVGGVTNAIYTPSITYCQPAPTDYTLLGGAVASLTGTYFGDSLGLAFRIGNTALTSGSVLVRVYERAPGDTWVTQQAFLAVPVIPSTSAVFVANDAATCSINSPCYVNSGDDAANGIGTGLKDAIDAQITPGTIDILGSYLLKSSAVLVDKAVTIRGVNDAILISGGASCNEPLLRIVQGATIRDVNLQGGSPCGTTRRDLIEVNSPADVTIQQNDFINGDDAVHIFDNTGNVTVQFNHIENNSGYALFREAGSGTGFLNAVANNFVNNRIGPDVECNSMGQVEHNFWGTSLAPSAASNQCNAVDGKGLGAAAQRLLAGAGVEAQRVTVNATKQYFFNNQVALQLAPEGSSVDMYVVSHGASGASSVPFTGGSPDDMTPCSNYWDVFLANGAALPESLTLALKYDQNPGCVASIESSSYCAQSDMARYPLWWYDPATNVTRSWDKTGQNPEGSGAGGVSGQVTTCNQAENEIQVVIDADGRPNLSNDLFFTPFVVGLPSTSSGVVITRFVGLPGNQQATIQWTTTSEVNVLGFYVQRSDQPETGFTTVSDYVPGVGTVGSGADYEFVNSGLTNGTTYYYRLQVVNMDLSNTYTGSIAVTPQLPTPTPTATVTPTTTNTVTATLTVTPLISATPTITSTITSTLTVTGTPPTATPTRTATLAPTRTKTLVYIATRTRTLIPSYTRRVVSPTSVNRTRTPTPFKGSATPISGTSVVTPAGYPLEEEATPTTSIIPTQANGYPDANETTEVTEGAAVTGVPRGTSVALTEEARPRLTSTVPSSGDEKTRPGWVVPLLILIFGLLAMLAVAAYLWLEGVLTLPFPVPAAWKKRKFPTAASLDAEAEDDPPADPPVDGMA